jgi:GAF domain-containing protein
MNEDENMSHELRPGNYIDKVREETATYVRRLISEMESLTRKANQLAMDNERLHAELRFTREELTIRDEKERQLRERLDTIRTESETYIAQFSELEQHNTNLANLYVATYQLHGTLDRGAVLEAIQEIVVNLIGSEDFGILERDHRTGELVMAASVGPLGREVSAEDTIVRNVLKTGTSYISGTPANDEVPACIPLNLDGETVGVIVIRGLLPHKTAFEPLDDELFGLLASHAATALYCSTFRERLGVTSGGVA